MEATNEPYDTTSDQGYCIGYWPGTNYGDGQRAINLDPAANRAASKPMNVFTLEDCKAACEALSTCRGISYSPRTDPTKCYLCNSIILCRPLDASSAAPQRSASAATVALGAREAEHVFPPPLQ